MLTSILVTAAALATPVQPLKEPEDNPDVCVETAVLFVNPAEEDTEDTDELFEAHV